MLIRVEGQNLTLERGGREDEFRFRFSRDWDAALRHVTGLPGYCVPLAHQESA